MQFELQLYVDGCIDIIVIFSVFCSNLTVVSAQQYGCCMTQCTVQGYAILQGKGIKPCIFT